MARIPIYQMSIGQNKEGVNGFVFSSELEEHDSLSIIFTIPITSPFDHPSGIEEYFYFNTFYFPFSLRDKYLELEAKVNFPDMVFEVPNTDFQVTFEIGQNDFYNWPLYRFRRNRYGKHRYVGNKNNLIKSNEGFITLLPVDLIEMDELYLQHRGTFVGLTPNFGRIETTNERQ